MIKRLIALITFIFISFNSHAQKIDHSLWTSFLEKNVTSNGKVNYKSIKEDEADLKIYLNQFIKTPPQDSWSKNEILAYWINAYNAFTIKLIVDNYPVKSIKDIKKPWDKKFILINGDIISLNYIEHDILRKMNEPRIHFAIVCASFSCPKLLNKAYTSNNLENQLTQVTKDFLKDSHKNKISEDSLELSKIFQWFTSDFKQNGSLIHFLNQYSNIKISEKSKVKYKDYNWNLNE